jgi:hypothetical protein
MHQEIKETVMKYIMFALLVSAMPLFITMEGK